MIIQEITQEGIQVELTWEETMEIEFALREACSHYSLTMKPMTLLFGSVVHTHKRETPDE